MPTQSMTAHSANEIRMFLNGTGMANDVPADSLAMNARAYKDGNDSVRDATVMIYAKTPTAIDRVLTDPAILQEYINEEKKANRPVPQELLNAVTITDNLKKLRDVTNVTWELDEGKYTCRPEGGDLRVSDAAVQNIANLNDNPNTRAVFQALAGKNDLGKPKTKQEFIDNCTTTDGVPGASPDIDLNLSYKPADLTGAVLKTLADNKDVIRTSLGTDDKQTALNAAKSLGDQLNYTHGVVATTQTGPAAGGAKPGPAQGQSPH